MVEPPEKVAHCHFVRLRKPIRMTDEQYEQEMEARCGDRDTAEFRVYQLQRYHRDLALKYSRAACRPWLLVTADPPRPD